MRLLRLKADFGPLRGEWRFDPRRVNLVVDDNERGKSSLLAALVAALYGLDGDRRTHRVLTPLERWRPWNGRPFEVTLEVETRAQRYLIHRDFDRDGVRIMDRDGDDVTAEFFEDKGYPVGRRLLGLDAAEFDRAAFLRLGDLDEVVPADERARRASTLRARLENAADTHIGDTNASEALRVLEEALRRYHAPELEFTGTVEVALDRLEAKRQMLLSERRTIEHDLERAAGPLERLTRLAEEEDALKQRLRALEAERHAGLAAELRQRLDEDDRARAEVARLEDEARTLEGVARLPQGLADEFRVTITRLAETRGNLDSQEQRQRERVEKERAALEAELASLAPYREHSSEQADQCAALAAELRRMTLDEARLRHEVFVLRDQLAAAGYEPERIQHLTQRFAHLPEESQRLLRQQNPLHLEFQTRVAELEQERTGASETLRGIDATRNARRVPGWVALALGIATAVAGGVAFALQAALPLWAGLAGGGALVAAAGGILLAGAARAQSAEREAALRQLAEAQRRLNTLRTQRAENEVALSALAHQMGTRDAVDLMRHWNEYARMLEDSAPFLRAQEQLAQLEARRRERAAEAAPLLAAVPGVAVTAEGLEGAAYDIRRALAKRQRLDGLEADSGAFEEERRVLAATAHGLEERALRLLQSAGLAHDPARSWEAHADDLAARMRDQFRHATVTEELLPAAQRRLLAPEERAQRERQVAELLAGRTQDAPPRTAAEVDLEMKQVRTRLADAQQHRADLRVEFEEIGRRAAHRVPELEAEVLRLERATARARRFKESVELARETIAQVATDTHRRWADFLNQRVGEILTQLGSSVRGVRFGEDLDYSVQTEGPDTLTRGRAALQLSTGARDQLHIAVRLAISEFLTRGGEPTPLLVDDAFATSDDRRLAAGMRTLIEGFATGHQVIVVTCHRGRHEDLRRLDPESFRERVHWVDLHAAAVPAPRA